MLPERIGLRSCRHGGRRVEKGLDAASNGACATGVGMGRSHLTKEAARYLLCAEQRRDRGLIAYLRSDPGNSKTEGKESTHD